MTHDEFYEVACRYLAGTASPDDVGRLEKSLESSGDFRRVFLEIVNLDAALEERANSVDGRRLPSRQPWLGRLPPYAAAILLTLGISGLVAGLLFNNQGRASVASVVRQIGRALPFVADQVVAFRRYELAEGTLEVVTATGVKVVLEAPVTFEFDSPQRLRLFRGRVAADVPPSGKGFTVVTPSGNAIDLGTSFGVAVGESGDTQVHVFEGEVIAESKEGTAKSVRCNEATSLSTPNAACDIRTGAFIRVAEMPALEAGFVSGQMVRGQEAMDRVRQDPSLVSLYDFDGRDMPSGQFTVVQGRWPGSRAVDFANAGDHMNVSIDEGRAWPQLTLAAWVRLDRLHDRNQSLYHADLWSEGAGHIHWMVSHLRTIRLAINGSVIAADAPERSGEPDSASAMNGALDRWIHVASVYDSESRTVRFFLNGLFDHESRLAVAPPAVLGRGQIGNWIGQERHLSGRIDELLVLGRALSDAEIADLHAATTPYR